MNVYIIYSPICVGIHGRVDILIIDSKFNSQGHQPKRILLSSLVGVIIQEEDSNRNFKKRIWSSLKKTQVIIWSKVYNKNLKGGGRKEEERTTE